MFSHVFIGVTDFERALAFYNPVMENLNIKKRFCDFNRPWAGWQCEGSERPLFLIGAPENHELHSAGNGQMTAFLASTREKVDTTYELAIKYGGACEGKPGLRLEYHLNFYGAYFRDPDSNKICVVCHEPAID